MHIKVYYNDISSLIRAQTLRCTTVPDTVTVNEEKLKIQPFLIISPQMQSQS